VRGRACAREAKWGDSRMSVWEDGQGKRYVGGEDVVCVSVPGVLRFLDVELGAMGVKLGVGVEDMS
jgi:DNA-directed RNA polymerase I subunit RPA2